MFRQYFKKIIIVLFVMNVYFIISLFHGKNTPMNYFKYKQQIQIKTKQLHSVINMRDNIEKISILLEHPNKNLDVLEEILRQSLQLSKENEVLILDNQEQ